MISQAVCGIGRAIGLSDDDLSKLDSEWKSYSVNPYTSRIADSFVLNNDVLQFWQDHDVKDGTDDGPSYSTFCRVAFGAMTVPSGNTACERILSELNDLLTKKRNRKQELSIDSVMCHHQWLLEGANLSCIYLFR